MTDHDTTGAAPGWTRLHWAVWDGDAGKISHLLEQGADPNARNKDGLTPLHAAAGHGNPAIIAALIEAGADPDARDENGYTLLHVVAAISSATWRSLSIAAFCALAGFRLQMNGVRPSAAAASFRRLSKLASEQP